MFLAEAVFKMVLANIMITSPVEFYSSLSKNDCMQTCLSKEWCLGASYSKQQHNCRLSNTSFSVTMIKYASLVTAPGWDTYQIYKATCPRHLSYILAWQPVPICYKVYHDRRVSQTEGKTQCEADGGTLITLDSGKKNLFIKSVLEKMNTTTFLAIGLEKINGEWMWPTGSSLTNYVSWASGKPDGSLSDKCVVMKRFDNFNWINVECSTLQNFICEVSIS